MEIFGSLIGNENIKKSLGSEIASSKFLHAYIIEGKKGTGKHTVARLAAAAIMCHGKEKVPCGECDTCRKILSDNCADVKFSDAFKVDDVRKIKETLYETSTECDYKVYIFNDAQKMNVKAQNALLISLEEPPENVVFFLLCTDANALLETVRSRAQILRTEPLDKKTIFEYVRSSGIASELSDERLNEIILCSGGSLGYVLDMANPQNANALIEKRQKALKLTTALLSPGAEGYSFISSLSSLSREDTVETLLSVLTALRDLIVLKKDRGANLCFFASRDEALSLSSKANLKKLTSFYDATEIAINDVNSNASVMSTLVSLYFNPN